MKYKLNPILACAIGSYSGASLLYYLSIYVMGVLYPETFSLSIILIYVSTLSIILPGFVTVGLYDASYEWPGFFFSSVNRLKFYRSILMLSILNFIYRLIWSCREVGLPEWNKESVHGELVIGLFYISILIICSLLVFLYALFGISSIASPAVIKFYRNPFSFIKAIRRKS